MRGRLAPGMGETERVEMPRQVYCELKTLRQMGTPLADADAVVARLDAYDFRAAREWVLDNPDRYVRAVREGMADETTAGDRE